MHFDVLLKASNAKKPPGHRIRPGNILACASQASWSSSFEQDRAVANSVGLCRPLGAVCIRGVTLKVRAQDLLPFVIYVGLPCISSVFEDNLDEAKQNRKGPLKM